MAQTTEQQQFEENFKRGVEEGRRSYALKIAKRMLAMPVRIGIPQELKGIIDEVEDTPFAVVIGV